MNRIFKVSTMLITSILFLFLANACTKSVNQNNSKVIISSPDKIILYNLGKSKEVKKGDKEFDKIINLTNDRIDTKKLSTVKDIIDDEFIAKKKNRVMAVEFIYNKEQKLNRDGLSTIKYKKLFFELDDALSSAMLGGPGHIIFQYGDSNHYKSSSIGPLNDSKELITIVKSIIY